MPLHTSLISAGAGSSIPISAGGGTSGDAFSGSGAINIGGLFGSGAKSAKQENLVPSLIIGGVVLTVALLLLRRRR